MPKDNNKQEQTYFCLANSWADDYYATTVSSRNRWRLICLAICAPIIMMLLICISVLIPSQHLQPILLHHYDNGYVYAQLPTQAAITTSNAERSSDIVRYVTTRESYEAFSYAKQYELINILSNAKVAKTYRHSQSASNPDAYVNILGRNGTRAVKILDVLYLDHQDKTKIDKTHRNLAQVNFMIVEQSSCSAKKKHIPMVALISWTYHGTPKNPSLAWQNWNGFEVTDYQLQRRNISV